MLANPTRSRLNGHLHVSPQDLILNLLTESNDWHAKAVLADPELCQYLLDNHNPINRKMYESRGRSYAREMSQGRWYKSSSGVGFDSDGMITNGQHRLYGVVESGKPQWLLFVFNCEKESRAVEDTAKPRSEADRLTLTGTNASNATVAIAKRVILGPRQNFDEARIIPVHLVREALECYENEIALIWEHAKTPCRHGSITGALVRSIPHIGADSALRFLAVAMSLESCSPSEQAAMYFGSWLLKNDWVRSSGPDCRVRLYCATQSALSKFVAGERIRSLVPVTDDRFPLKPELAEAIQRPQDSSGVNTGAVSESRRGG